ncbi:MAG TPA: 3-methylcrotonyl-CoA carboxylase, partial [Planctomycetota bacterium]|nr:3-methylcrotonyl-CoA carboxylase [Planctomycetota bacterium]
PEGEACFLEMNTRIQVEHPVTEMICGIDIVLEQLEIAQGATLPSTFDEARRAARGHAIEARVNAEDVLRDFQPATGRIARIDLPGGPGVRVDAGIAAGDEVLPYYDTLLAKVISHGDDRKQALARLLVACEGMRIFGVTTTLPFTRALLATPTFATGAYHCQSVAELLRTSGFVRASVKDDGSLARLAAAAAFLASRERKRASERDRASVPRAGWSRDLGGAPGWE